MADVGETEAPVKCSCGGDAVVDTYDLQGKPFDYTVSCTICKRRGSNEHYTLSEALVAWGCDAHALKYRDAIEKIVTEAKALAAQEKDLGISSPSNTKAWIAARQKLCDAVIHYEVTVEMGVNLG